MEAHHRVGNDLIQHGFWGCAEAFCETSTTEAVVLVDKWLSLAPDAPSLWAIGNMIGWLRRSIGPDHPAFSAFSLLEARVQAPGYAAWRALYIQSWVHAGGMPLLNEKRALELNRQFVQPGSDEEVAWCFLLKGIVTTDRHAWRWVHRELSRIARPTLSDRAKHWIVDATLHGAEFGTSVDEVSPGQWGDVLRALLPIAATSVGTWRRIHHSMVTLAGNNAVVMRGLIKTIANSSGGTWIELLRQREFGWLATALREKGLHVDVSTDLCFGQGAQSRQIGLFFFAESGAARLDLAVVESATATQVELLLLEAQRRQIDYESLARLHGCLTVRVEQLGEELHELFYEEMTRQCINTHNYRSTLSSVTDHWYVAELLADVEARLAAIQQASVSSALQMEAPGQAHARALEAQRLTRTVAKGVKDHSVFLNLVHTVHLLYGGDRWRMFDSNGTLGQPSKMHMTSSTVEVPRLEFQDPEGMYIRRVMASARIASLERLEHSTAAPDAHEA